MESERNFDVVSDVGCRAEDSEKIDDLIGRYDILLAEIEQLGQTMDSILASVNALSTEEQIASIAMDGQVRKGRS